MVGVKSEGRRALRIQSSSWVPILEVWSAKTGEWVKTAEREKPVEREKTGEPCRPRRVLGKARRYPDSKKSVFSSCSEWEFLKLSR